MMLKILKFRLLFFILMILHMSSSTKDFSDIFKFNMTSETYLKRMQEKGLPHVGQVYSDYLKQAMPEDTQPITELEFKILMDSIPRIYETMESVNKRNSENEEFKKQIYTPKLFKYLNKCYPYLYESFDQYTERIQNNGLPKLFDFAMFTGLKKFCPILGETYNDYESKMSNTFGLLPFTKTDYESFRSLYPKLGESLDHYSVRVVEVEKKKQWKCKLADNYRGLQYFFPQLGEYYKEYETRMNEINILGMPKDSFSVYQQLFPHVGEGFKQYSKMPRSTELMISLDVSPLDEDGYNRMKIRLPILFENLSEYKTRMSIHVFLGDLISDKEYFHAKRIYPKMSESYNTYFDRFTNQLSMGNPLNENLFKFFKNNYPQFGKEFETKNLVTWTNVYENSHELTLGSVNDCENLKKKMPVAYESYEHYVRVITNIPGVTPLSEYDFYDFKRVFIRQSETFTDYLLRMINLDIEPMENQTVLYFKQMVPRELNQPYKTYLNEIAKHSLDISDINWRPFKAFTEVMYLRFQLVAPISFESYYSYTNRISSALFNTDFMLFYTKNTKILNKFPENTFQDFLINRIQALDFDEFTDLKLRYPKLSEEPKQYMNRIKSYMLNPLIRIDNGLFEIFKKAHVQLEDDYERYIKRITALDIKKIKLLHSAVLNEKDFNTLKDYYISFPYIIDHSEFHKPMCAFENNDINDIQRVYPRYYETLQEHSKLMERRFLEPLSRSYFLLIKLFHPTITDKNFEEYECRINIALKKEMYTVPLPGMVSIVQSSEFQKWKSRIPYPYEGYTSYVQRVQTNFSNLTEDELKQDYDDMIKIYPQLSDTYEDYVKLMNDMLIQPLEENDYKHYKFYCPNIGADYNNYLDNYNNLKPGIDETLKKLNISIMTEDEFSTFISRIPSPYERYLNYHNRIISYSKLIPFVKNEFDDYENLYTLPYETYLEYNNRLKCIDRIAVPLHKFKDHKACQVLLGESYTEHLNKIEKFYSINLNEHDEHFNVRWMEINGIETLGKTNFVEHMLIYPSYYESYEMFTFRNKYKWPARVLSNDWYQKMSDIAPRMCENYAAYARRVGLIKGLPYMTKEQFDRFIQGLPLLGESSEHYNVRVKQMFEEESAGNKPLKLFGVYEIIEWYLEDLHKHFIRISPNFFTEYTDYAKRLLEHGNQPLDIVHFNCLQYYFPKINETYDEFCAKIQDLGLQMIEMYRQQLFFKLKKFYPRVHHHSYEAYLLEIGLEYPNDEDYINVNYNSPKLTRAEFNEYKLSELITT
ncbi:Hypothetical protein CINCED_3A016358 [Cinara cedri]|uniref:Uncharacterized protein n=1 Tax=Cinara cedri TaxID=506608 RepID=A0A5E4MFQ8_9HEMI|nr:Hypothetical protein CINCED_3A016358 [Cinara cedri]